MCTNGNGRMKKSFKGRVFACITFSMLFGCVSANAVKEKEEGSLEIPSSVQPEPAAEIPVESPKAPEPEGISDDDLKRAIQNAVRDLMRSGVLDNPNGDRYVVTVSRIVNLSKAEIDIPLAVKRLSSNLATGKKVKVTYGNPAAGNGAKSSVHPEINVSARITQRTAHVRSGKRIEYYLHLNLTEIKSGIGLWENSTPVLKRRKKSIGK